MKISIIGTGYVGLVTGVCLSDFGLEVICVDKDEKKIKILNSGDMTIYEPNLKELLKKNIIEGRLKFSNDLKFAIEQSQVIFIAVGTPSNNDGSANLNQIGEVARQIAKYINDYKVIVNKSTVPVGTAQKVKNIISKYQSKNYSFDVVSNPEFLREGSAVYDFTHPDKIVIGSESSKALNIMKEIYRPLYLLNTPFVITNLETAEMIKYTCNAFLATKITFINEVANLCEKVGADVHQIAQAMGLDGRISAKYLHPGPGYGGSCFPKDTKALYHFASEKEYDFKMLDAVINANKRQREIMVGKIKRLVGNLKDKTIGILGLAFKPNTDDIRESASLDIIKLLLKEGARIKCYDPLAVGNTKKILPEIAYCSDEYETAQDSDALVIATEWNQFRNLNLLKIKKILKNPILIDLKNLYEPKKMKEIGFIYEGVGRL
jgi:UDPglucose 6-dehydrogenase